MWLMSRLQEAFGRAETKPPSLDALLALLMEQTDPRQGWFTFGRDRRGTHVVIHGRGRLPIHQHQMQALLSDGYVELLPQDSACIHLDRYGVSAEGRLHFQQLDRTE
jgi:hypothetical protein